MSVQIHDFNERNTWSLAAKQEAFWGKVYHKAFPSMVGCELNTDKALQLIGVDRLITLANGIALTVDEKARQLADTGDILLEYAHEGAYNAPGWIEKDLSIDYLAYGFIPSKRCYLFDWRMLRRAWGEHGGDWKARYQHIKATNSRYNTWSIAIPTDILQRAVSMATVIEIDKGAS